MNLIGAALSIALSLGTFTSAAASTIRPVGVPRVCVATFSSERETIASLHAVSEYYLTEGHKFRLSDPIPFTLKTGGIEALRECLEGPYESVILISHSVRLTKDLAALMETDETSKTPIEGRSFEGLRVSATVKRFTFVACFAEEVMRTYPAFARLIRSSGAAYSAPPPSPVLEQLSGLEGVRAMNSIGLIIAREVIGPTFQENFK